MGNLEGQVKANQERTDARLDSIVSVQSDQHVTLELLRQTNESQTGAFVALRNGIITAAVIVVGAAGGVILFGPK